MNNFLAIHCPDHPELDCQCERCLKLMPFVEALGHTCPTFGDWTVYSQQLLDFDYLSGGYLVKEPEEVRRVMDEVKVEQDRRGGFPIPAHLVPALQELFRTGSVVRLKSFRVQDLFDSEPSRHTRMKCEVCGEWRFDFDHDCPGENGEDRARIDRFYGYLADQGVKIERSRWGCTLALAATVPDEPVIVGS